MKAIRIHAYGDANVLTHEDAPVPTPSEGEVLVRVRAAGVNPIDWKIRAGYVKDWIPHSFPFIPGVDFSGVVEEVGPSVSGLKASDEVFGEANILVPTAAMLTLQLRQPVTSP
jgi:NADPH:quinone reductase-like Zn-dependent oxidoreductase